MVKVNRIDRIAEQDYFTLDGNRERLAKLTLIQRSENMMDVVLRWRGEVVVRSLSTSPRNKYATSQSLMLALHQSKLIASTCFWRRAGKGYVSMNKKTIYFLKR